METINNTPPKTISFVAGKSGGHIIPCLTLAEHYKKTAPHTPLLFFSTTAPLDTQIIQPHNIDTHVRLSFGSNSRMDWWSLPRRAGEFLYAFIIGFYQLIAHRPERIISSGGLVSIPIITAAWILRIPIELYELNAVPGKATRLLAPLATHIHVCFAHARRFFNPNKTTLSDYPIRFNTLKKISSKDARTALNLSPHRFTLCIVGGSQGSRFINDALQRWLLDHPEIHTHIQIIHQAGHHNADRLKAWYAQHAIPAHVFDYANDLSTHYHASDYIVARAGAGTLFELLFFNKHSLIVPLEIPGNNHQLNNAQAMIDQQPDLFTMQRQSDIEKHGLAIPQWQLHQDQQRSGTIDQSFHQ